MLKTKIIEIDPNNIELDKIKYAAEIIKKGGLVAFPTETVYGIGADALSSHAVKKIYHAKGRPSDNPMIIHIAEIDDLTKLVTDVNEDAHNLLNSCWPGPLTVVLKKSKIIPDIVTASLDSVAIRMPSNKIALSLIKEAGLPIAAPSANTSTKPSPTCAKHVIDDLFGKVDVIIDGGETNIGLESTVLDLTTDTPTLLRPGGYTLEYLESVIGKKIIQIKLDGKNSKNLIPKSPGMKYRHYSPKADVILVEGNFQSIQEKIQHITDLYLNEGKSVGIMTINEFNNYKSATVKFMGKDLEIIAKNIFKLLRELDEQEIDIIIVEGVEEKELGLAIMNRLRKAASKIIKT